MADSIANVSIKFNADDKSVYSSLDKLEKRLRYLEKSKQIKVNTIADTSGLTKLQKQIKDATSNATASINLDNTQALRGIDVLKARYDVLAKRIQERVSTGIDVNSASLQGQLTQLGVMKAKLQDLAGSKVDFGNVFSNAGNTLQGISTKLNDIGNKMALVSGIAVSGIAVGLGKVFTSGIKNAQDYEMAFADMVATIGGNEAKKTFFELDKFANVTPFETGDLLQTAKSLGSVVTNSEELVLRVKQLGDASGGSADKLAGLAYVFPQIIGRGELMAQDLAQVTNAAPKLGGELKALQRQLGRNLTAEEFLATLDKSTEGFKRLEEGGKTLTGKLSTLSDAFKKATLSAVGVGISEKDGLFFKQTGVAQKLKDVLDKLINGNALKSLNSLGEALSNALGSKLANLNIDDLDQKISNFITNIQNNLPKIISTISTVFSTIKNIVTTAYNAFIKIASIVGGGNIATGIERIAIGLLAFGPALKVLAPLTNALGGLAKGIGLVLKTGGFKALFSGASTGALSGISGALSGVVTAVGSFLAGTGGIVLGIVAIVAALALFGGGAKDLLRDITSAFDGIKQIFSGLFNFIKGIFTTNGQLIKDGFIQIFSGLGSLLGGVMKLLFDLLFFAIKGAIKLLVSTNPLIFLARLLFDSNFREEFLNTAKGVLGGIFDSIKGFMANFVKSISGGKINLFGINDLNMSKSKQELDATKAKVDALKTALDLLSGKTLDLSQAELSLKNLNIQLEEAHRLTQEALANAGNNTQDPAYIQALTNELGIKQQILSTNDAVMVAQQGLNNEYSNFISKINEGVSITQVEKDSLLAKLDLLRQQREALGGNSAEIQVMIDKVTAINATPVNVNTNTNAPDTSAQLDTTKNKMDNITNSPVTATVNAQDNASRILDNIFNILDSIPVRKTIEIVANKIGDFLGFSSGGIVPLYRAAGGAIGKVKTLYAKTGSSVFKPKGTDTVPAMLTAGEFVTRRGIVSRLGKGFFEAQNNGSFVQMVKELIAKEPQAVIQALKDFALPNNNFDYKDVLSGVNIPNPITNAVTNNNQKNVTINANFSSNSSQRAGEFSMLNNFQHLIATGGI